jgi:hypothetical protein
MLKIYDAEMDNIDKLDNIVHDVEEGFNEVLLRDDEATRNLLKYIDQAEYYDERRFVDRFGVCVYISELSTGCKAALCVHYLQDKIIDLIECGRNARDGIIKYCKDGAIIVYDLSVSVTEYSGTISVEIHNKQIDNVKVLNNFINSYEYCMEGDSDVDGVSMF